MQICELMSSRSVAPEAKRSKMQSEEIDTYYFVSISYPFMSSDMNKELFTSQATERFRGNEVKGEFVLQCVETKNGTKHRFYLFEFESSRAASNAKANDFMYFVEDVHTDKILCNISTQLCIDFKLTTISAANAARNAGIRYIYQVMFDLSKDNDQLKEFAQKVYSKGPSVIQGEPTEGASIIQPEPTEGASVIQPEPTKGASVIQPEPTTSVVPLLPIELPEIMYNEPFFSQIEKVATDMGLTVVNKKNIDTSIISKASQYMNFRPDLVVYHSDNLVAYVVHTVDTEPDVTLMGGMTENKLLKREALGQLLGGMEKVAGDLAYLHIQRNIDIQKEVYLHRNFGSASAS